jgi:hypothetical protein
MDLEPSRPIAQVFLHSSDFYRGRIEQVLQVADRARHPHPLRRSAGPGA